MVLDAELFQSHFCCRTITSPAFVARNVFAGGNSLASANCADKERFFGKGSNLPNFGVFVFRSAQPQRRLSVSYFKPPNRRIAYDVPLRSRKQRLRESGSGVGEVVRV